MHKKRKKKKRKKGGRKTLIKLRRVIMSSRVENIFFRRIAQYFFFFFLNKWQNLIKTSKILRSKPKFRFPGIFSNIPQNLSEDSLEFLGMIKL